MLLKQYYKGDDKKEISLSILHKKNGVDTPFFITTFVSALIIILSFDYQLM